MRGRDEGNERRGWSWGEGGRTRGRERVKGTELSSSSVQHSAGEPPPLRGCLNEQCIPYHAENGTPLAFEMLKPY